MSSVAAGGRNAPCPCGSGRKAKRCHDRTESGSPSAAHVAAARAAAARASRIAGLLATADDDYAAARYPAVVAHATTVLRLEPANGLALSLLGLVAHRGRRPEMAAEYLSAAVAAAPHDPRIRRRLASVLADAGLVEEAIAQLELAVAAPPGEPSDVAGIRGGPAGDPPAGLGADLATDIAADLASLHLRAGRPDAASRFCELALAADSNNRAALATRVTLDMAAGRLADARAGYERIARLSDRPDLAEHRIVASPVGSIRDWTRSSGDPYTVVRPSGPLEIARPR